MAKGTLILLLAHLLIWRQFYFINPFAYATSECLEQGFSSFILLGRHLRRYGLFSLRDVSDPYYYPHYAGLPFLSSYYLPHRLVAWSTAGWTWNSGFLAYQGLMVAHFLASAVAVLHLSMKAGQTMETGLFTAISLSWAGCWWKQQSSLVYTAAWAPVMLLAASSHQAILLGISGGMMLTAGYWPICLLTFPVALCCWLFC